MGGIAGGFCKFIKYSYNTGEISGGYQQIGGIAGYGGSNNSAEIYSCYNKGNVKTNSNSSTNSLGGIVGRFRRNGIARYCYNLGTVTNDYTTFKWLGGVIGCLDAYDGTSNASERASKLEYCYNSGNVSSKGTHIGGICGISTEHCLIDNCYRKINVPIECNGTNASSRFGAPNNYLGYIVGYAYSTSTTYVDKVGVLDDDMPTVYNVLNELDNGQSEYWSNSNVNEPKLLWEESINK